MDAILRQYGYSVSDATWFYLSLLLILAVFFRFNRILSLRNLDLALLLSIAPGLLLVQHGYNYGHGWLFVVTGCWLIRLFSDSIWKRRPLLEQNLNSAGMAFLAVSVFVLLVSKALTEPPSPGTVETVRRADELVKRQDTTQEQSAREEVPAGPTAPLLAAPVVAASDLMMSSGSPKEEHRSAVEQIAARTTAVLAHLAVVSGLWFLGKRLFGDANSGLAMATLYLLLPCTAIDVGRVNHVLPAALIVWAFVFYRNPLIAGGLMGLACGTLLFPLFLLPLWAVFYGKQGAGRFALSLGLVAAVLIASLLLTSADSHSFTQQILGSIDWSSLTLDAEAVEGFWEAYPAYRIPVIVAFFVMLLTLTFLPREKNLEHLLGHSAAIVVGTQLWYPQQGGAYVLWYLPLLLAVVFRPKLASQTPPVIVPAPSEEKQLAMPARVLTGMLWFRRRGS
ncbi:MAG: hypothetical protein FD138_133 [Planctomycetota bacterium]|nr:MAG: hypothetical protein FD138_133 [Planctomycetota bacterium]